MTVLLICADAGADVGTGHLRRMLTLATALQQAGAALTLQTSRLGAEIAQAADSKSALIVAPCTPQAVARTLKLGHFDGVILDNYWWNTANEIPLRTHVPFLAVVDDLADRSHDADVLLDQNAHHDATVYNGLLPDHCRRLVGGRYCLLSAPFQNERTPALTKPNAPIFVSLGGGDPHRDLVAVVKTLLANTALPLTIATGSHITDAAALRNLAETHSTRLEVIFDSPSVADQMERSQFAVAAGGTMTWERASMGLPSLCLIVADNQIDSAVWLAKRDIHTQFDLRPGWSKHALADAVKSFAADTKRQHIHHDKSRALVARDGAVRAAQGLLDSLNKTSLA